MQKTTLIFLFIMFQNLYYSQSVKGFAVPDSLKTRNLEQLQNDYNRVFRIDNNKAELLANAILVKGKKENNNNYIYDGYYKLAHIKGLKSENGYPYADSLLKITQHINSKEYPAKAYIIKGILLNYEYQYTEALNQYITAQKLCKNKNPDQFYYLKKLIGILKTATGENEEALPLFLEYYKYEKQKQATKDQDIKSYIGSIFSVANCYNKEKQYRNALRYIDLGINECNKYKDYTHYAYFISAAGISNYYIKNYIKSEAYHLEAEKKFLKNGDSWNLAITYYFLGKINYDIHKEDQAIQYFIRTDSVLSVSKDFDPLTRDGYEILIDYYKKKDDKPKQLKYINKLVFVDSIINKRKQYLSKEIYKKYDTPILLEKKEELIHDLSNKNSLLYIFLGIGLFCIFLLIYFYNENRKKIKEYKKQAESLLKQLKFNEYFTVAAEEVITTQDPVAKPERMKSVPDEVLHEIKIKLERFENNKKFLRKNTTVDSLSRDFKTNRDYLSKSVNELKGKNFSQYLNELRVNYIIHELKDNEKLRKHTIAAIAGDIGYNNAESFSNAFKKITGTLPSYYIKQLES